MKRNKFFEKIFDYAAEIQGYAFDDKIDISNKVMNIIDLIRKIRDELSEAVLHDDLVQKSDEFLISSILKNDAFLQSIGSKIESLEEKQINIANETRLMRFVLDQKMNIHRNSKEKK